MKASPFPAGFLSVFLLFGLIAGVKAGVLVQYDFGTASVTSLNPSVIDPHANDTIYPFAAGSGLTAGFGVSKEAGHPIASAYVNSTYATEAVSSSSTDYIGFTLAADSGYRLDLSTLAFDYAYTGGDNTQSATFTIRTSLDSFASNVGVLSTARQNTSGASVVWSAGSIDLGGAVFDSFSSIEFRIYLTDSGTISNSFFRIDNVTVNGAVIPEPHTWGLLLGGITLAGMCRRLARRA